MKNKEQKKKQKKSPRGISERKIYRARIAQ